MCTCVNINDVFKRFTLIQMTLTFRRDRSIVLIIAILILLTNVYIFLYYYVITDNSDDIQCYRLKTKTLPNIVEETPTKGKAIFFHETSCTSNLNGKIVITSRQACAVESAAKLNPNYEVYLLYVSPGILKFEGSESDRFLQALLSYDNIKIKYLNIEEYVKDTLVEDIFKKKIAKSLYPKIHTSDILRLLTLWKYGGIYLDLDVVVIKTLENMPLNFAGSESNKLVASGVLGFDPVGAGHNMVTQCLKDIKYNFDGDQWTHNGPDIITRLSKRLCAADDVNDMVTINCVGDFKVHPPEAFYPIPWWNWTQYFDPNVNQEVHELIENSYMIHVWNKLSYSTKIPLNSEVPYLTLARRYCPKVFNECNEFF